MSSSVPVLVKRHVFGINNCFKNNIAFLDSRVLIYVAARNIVFYNIEEHSQRFVIGSAPSTENWVSDPEICSVSLSPSTRYLAIAERGENPCFTVLDTQTLRKNKFIALPSTIRSKEICAMAFSVNNRYLAVQCGCPDWKLCIFEWEQGVMEHCITTSKDMTPVHQISYLHNNPDPSPNDPNSIAICHAQSIQIYQQNGQELSQQSIEMNGYSLDIDAKWICQCWMDDDTLLCGNSDGDVIVLKKNKFHEIILSKKPKDDEEYCGITYIQYIKRGIVAIGAQDCTVSFLHKSVENGVTTWNVICTVSLCSSLSDNNSHQNNNNESDKPIPYGMTVDPPAKQLLITTSNKQIYSLDIANMDPYSDDHNHNAITISQPLGHFHFAGICGMDICIRKPWIVTCSEDKSICIWNYLTRKLEICKYFATKIRCVSFHPSGLHILAGFEDKLKLLNVLMDDIEPYKDFHIVRNCHECTFANGGHIFAAVNGDKIHIYNTYSGELISILRGHNQKIKSLYFSLDDTSLISAGAEGAVYEWSMFSFNRIQEMVNRQCPLNTAIITRDKKIYCTGNTPLLNEIMDSQLEKEIDIGTGLEITRLIISHLPQRMMFAVTMNGLVRSMKFPLSASESGDPDQPNHLDYVGHLGCIERLVISQDDIYLFTCGGQDGCIMIFEIRDKEGRLTSASPSRAHAHAQNVVSSRSISNDAQNGGFSTEILVTTSYLSERQQMFAELSNKVDELKLHNEYQLRLREMHYHETLKDREDKFNRELSQQKLKYEVLKDEQQDMEMEYEEKIKLAEDQHCKQVQELESFYQSQLMSEIETYRDLEVQMTDRQSNWEQVTFTAQNKHETQLMNLRDRNEQILNAEMQRKQKLNYEYEELRKEYSETKEQLLNDFDVELEGLNDKYLCILNEERENTLRLKGENGVMRKKFTSLQNEIDDQMEETKKMNLQETNFKKTIVSLKKEITKLDNAMVSRDNVIGEKEKKIYKLKKKNQNLEKHKFVLDYKIKSLKKQIEPRQNKICAMKENVKSLDKELEDKHKENGELKLCIQQLNQNINQMQSQTERKKEKYKKLRSCVNKFSYDLSRIIEFIQSPKQLAQYFEDTMYSASFKKFVDQNYDINNNVLEEYDQQRKHLMLSVNRLKKTLNEQSKVNRKENYQIMMENVEHINEIQQLRKELKMLTQINNNESELKEEQQMLQNHIEQQNIQIQELRNQIQTI